MTEKAFKKILTDVGVELARLREKKGYSRVKDFAARYDLPAIHYWRIEKGQANITLKSLVKILAVHRVDLAEFFVAAKKNQRARRVLVPRK